MLLPFEIKKTIEVKTTQEVQEKTGIIASEFGIKSPVWEMNSGTLYLEDGCGSTGVPTTANNSAVFRMNTIKADFENVEISMKLMALGLGSLKTPVDYDGCHIWMRFLDEAKLYYASVNRRDNKVIIKKKTPPGPSNGGLYEELSGYIPYDWKIGEWQDINISCVTQSDKSVYMRLWIGGKLFISAVDKGTPGNIEKPNRPPIVSPGKIGIRCDNGYFRFKDFTVTQLK